MIEFEIGIAAITSIILFVFGLQNFSKEIQRIAGSGFRKFIAKATGFAPVGVLIGAVVTAFIQSSSATSIVAISLVNAGVLSFKNSVGIIIGSNIGTTVTAQLIAFKLTSFAPLFIILGFALSFVKSKYSVFGKSLFYFGFVFFSLNLISGAIEPLKADPRIIGFLTQAQSPFVGILIGCLITALIQSSSVTTGLAVIFTQQGLLSIDNAIPILMGANIGTTVTALISIVNMDVSAKKTALAHLLFNVGGVLLFIPIILMFKGNLPFMSGEPAIALANFHFVFNVSTSIVFILALKPFTRFIDKIMGEGKMDFERLELPTLDEETRFESLEVELGSSLKKLLLFLQENYNLVTLSIETNYKGIYEASKKRLEYVDYFKGELQGCFSNAAAKLTAENELERLVRIIGLYEYVFQIHDSIKDLAGTKESMDAHYIELKSDLLLLVRELAGRTLALFGGILKDGDPVKRTSVVKKEAVELQGEIDRFNREILQLMSSPDRKDAGSILHMVTYNQRLKDKLVNYNKLRTKSPDLPIH